MVRYVPDRTGRFTKRPYFRPEELDEECENIVLSFLQESYGKAEFPISTDDLTRLIERESGDLDQYADLGEYGPDVEGATEFWHGQKPRVKISKLLTGDARRENRLRTTLSHEYGHVHFHANLLEFNGPQHDVISPHSETIKQICKRDAISSARATDWMEWQAGYVCGALLMPASRVGGLVEGYKESHNLLGSVGVTSEHGQALISSVRTSFQVSSDAARVRLLQFNFLSDFNTEQPLPGR